MKEKGLKFMSKLLTLIFVISTSIIAIILNFANSFEGNGPDIKNIITSVVFVFIWIIFSIYKGSKKDEKYLKFIVIYWVIALVLMTTVAIANKFVWITPPFLIPIFIWFTIPLYGICIPILITSYIYVPVIIILGGCIWGYYVAKNFKTVNKWLLIISILALLVISAGVKASINHINDEFTKYFETNYPNDEITLHNITIDIVSLKASAIAISDEQYYRFEISKGLMDNKIKDGYVEEKNKKLKYFYIEDIFNGTKVEKNISLITERDEIKNLDAKRYNRILIVLTPEADTVNTIKEIFNILKSEKIIANEIDIEYEKSNKVNEVKFSDKDYDLTEKQIIERLEMVN